MGDLKSGTSVTIANIYYNPIERTYEQTKALTPDDLKPAIKLHQNHDDSFRKMIRESIGPEDDGPQAEKSVIPMF